MSLPPGNFLDATHKCSRHRGGHLALWVFWAQGGSPETGAWEASSMSGGGTWRAGAPSFTLPAPAAAQRGLPWKARSESAEPHEGTLASS